ncbi:helix-turn-helix domain-containing protein [Levilactobacillus sp. HBUAS70063]|uniref:helix-turn-helix domain-containing protein n=1 Tax=Levilactobacillus sp. HBUAS70063 TaxID=3109359 RepID=UPI003132AF47
MRVNDFVTQVLQDFLVLTPVVNITTAAKALHTTPPIDLEAELDTRLLIRAQRRVTNLST